MEPHELGESGRGSARPGATPPDGESGAGRPRLTLRARDAVAITVGIVIGAGIFRTPSVIAGAAGSEAAMLAAWAAGGLLSIVGALCYAELAAAYPHAGGDYHFLGRAFGPRLAFLYAWARLAVIQTGSIALLAFVFGDYAARLAGLGPSASPFLAALAVALLTAINWAGIRKAAGTQNWLTAVELLGLVLVIVAGLLIAPAEPVAHPAPVQTNIGLVMVFVLLTFGGWSEAAYISAELRDVARRIAPVMVGSLMLVTLLYLLANLAYLRVLGLGGLAASETVAADLLDRAFGAPGLLLMSALVAIATLTSANATMITGARSAYALGEAHRPLAWLGRWNSRTGTPGTAVLVQGAAALLLVAIGSLTRDGFETAVAFTAPVFWFFFLLVGVSLFVLRRRDPAAPRPFRVPLYPLLPLIFCATTFYLLYSSIAYTGVGALFGIIVLVAGAVPLLAVERRSRGADTRAP
ncbi:APC family permease [Sphingosinicella sp. CPCC 101087]|uniref:APC family permease n=1 Tax=Sphingosinicella sp. CPCC 101087 TaxID=2497754 RepID=UPI00101C08FC|nr:APC family permease [Sphingosinicella sp. CPCC 101087]